MSFPRYSKYKASGVKWLGEVPEHWEVKRLKHVASIAMGQSPNSEDCNSDGNGLPFLQGNADFGDSCPTARSFCPVATKLADPGDILLSVRAPVGAINLADQKYGIGRGLCAIRSAPGNTVRFLLHALTVMKTELFSVATGSTYEAVTTQQVGNVVCLVPPLPEQTAIAAFLDRETGKIDALVAEQRRLMELLKEKRQAVISHAVTRGLNPAAPMKDSGIEWLGEVPVHWQVGGMTKYLSSIVDYRGRTPTKVDEGVFLLTARNIRNGKMDYIASQEFIPESEYEDVMRRGKPELGDVVFTTEAPLGQVANMDRTDVALAQRVLKFRGQAGVLNNYFLKYWLMGSFAQADMERLATGSTALGLKGSKVVQLRLCLPPDSEQLEIVSFLEAELAKFDALIAEAQRAIDLLQERRTALISAAVTGQIDVRETRTPS